MAEAYHLKRINAIQNLLEHQGLVALIVDDPIDLYYLTGIELSKGRLFLSIKSPVLFVDGRYIEVCARHAAVSVELTQSYDQNSAFGKLVDKKGAVAFDASKTVFHDYLELKKLFSDLVPVNSPIKRLRAIKERHEIEKLKKAANLNEAGYNYAVSVLRPNISEKKVAVDLEIFFKLHGGDKLAFDPIVAFGSNTALPHHRSSNKKLHPHEVVLFDIGVVVDHYHSDMTRVLLRETKDIEIKKIFQIVQDAQFRALEKCQPGTRIKDLDLAARDWITQKGYGNYFSHSLGHGVGLEIHEFPSIRSYGEDAELLLEKGMVITIEPGIYLPGKGGVRVEDTIVITADGFQFLAKNP